MYIEELAYFLDYRDDDGAMHELTFLVPLSKVTYDFHFGGMLILCSDIKMEPDNEALRRQVMAKYGNRIRRGLMHEYKTLK
jgi:hypothetical protein